MQGSAEGDTLDDEVVQVVIALKVTRWTMK
jgi:hypothetical protein